MEQITDISEVRGRERNLHPVHLLKEVDVTDQMEMEDIWNHIKDLDYTWDDLTKDRVDMWILALQMPTTKVFRIGTVGIVVFANIRYPVEAAVHHAIWAPMREVAPLKRQAMHEIFSLAFDQWKLNRLSTFVPDTNKGAAAFALSAGYRFEGCCRKAWLKDGHYHDVSLFGILRYEWERRKKVN